MRWFRPGSVLYSALCVTAVSRFSHGRHLAIDESHRQVEKICSSLIVRPSRVVVPRSSEVHCRTTATDRNPCYSDGITRANVLMCRVTIDCKNLTRTAVAAATAVELTFIIIVFFFFYAKHHRRPVFIFPRGVAGPTRFCSAGNKLRTS